MIQKTRLPRVLEVRPLAGLGRKVLIRMEPRAAARKLFGCSVTEKSLAVQYLKKFGIEKGLFEKGYHINIAKMKRVFSGGVPRGSYGVPKELVLRKGEERTCRNATIAVIGRLGGAEVFKEVFKHLDIPERETIIALIVERLRQEQVECLRQKRPDETGDQMAAFAKQFHPDSRDLQEKLIVDVARKLFPRNSGLKAAFMLATLQRLLGAVAA